MEDTEGVANSNEPFFFHVNATNHSLVSRKKYVVILFYLMQDSDNQL